MRVIWIALTVILIMVILASIVIIAYVLGDMLQDGGVPYTPKPSAVVNLG